MVNGMTGLVPTIKYSIPGQMEEETIYESAIVSQFLCDSFPGHLLPSPAEGPAAALKRARINFFVDTWNTKVQPGESEMLSIRSTASPNLNLANSYHEQGNSE